MTSDLELAFSGRSVFVTGHTGFKGSWLVLWLKKLGAQVTGYALKPPTDPSNFSLSRVQELLVAHHEADIRDLARLRAAVEGAHPDVIFHLAAQPLVRYGYEHPLETLEVNVMGTAFLLDAVRELGRPCTVIVVTSDKCYENTEQVWGYREVDPMGGHDPYSASKGAAELIAGAYRRSYFPPRGLAEHRVKVASARAGNVIGGGDWAEDRLVADIVRHVTAGKPVPIRNPDSVRPWQHVLEPLSGYLKLGAAMLGSDDPKWCSGWNFGPRPGDEASVRELAARFFTAWGEGTWEHVPTPLSVREAGMLRLSIDKATRELGWLPRWELSTAITRTALWYYRVLVDRQDARTACVEELCEYESS